MRKLNKKQKELIENYFIETGKTIYSEHQIESHTLSKIVKLNFYETIYNDINRHLNDIKFSY